jgi:GT2 family glycosyltransferase
MLEKETVALAWLDSGLVQGKCAEGLVYAALTGNDYALRISDMIRVRGIQIQRQRQRILEIWKETTKTDWLLWIDSDIVLNKDALEKILNCADKEKHRMISGVYYISLNSEESLMEPRICLFDDNEKYAIMPIKNMPENKLIKVDISGFGFLLMHKSVMEEMFEKYPDQNLFEEEQGLGDKFIGEDVTFLRKARKIGIPLYAHTGAFVQHMKTFALDLSYHHMYWDNAHKIIREK